MTKKNSILEMLLMRDKDFNIKYLKDEVTRIHSPNYKVGDAVNILTNGDNSQIALPVGKYDLKNNEVLIVKDEGVIHSIGKKQKESEIIKALKKRKM